MYKSARPPKQPNVKFVRAKGLKKGAPNISRMIDNLPKNTGRQIEVIPNMKR